MDPISFAAGTKLAHAWEMRSDIRFHVLTMSAIGASEIHMKGPVLYGTLRPDHRTLP